MKVSLVLAGMFGPMMLVEDPIATLYLTRSHGPLEMLVDLAALSHEHYSYGPSEIALTSHLFSAQATMGSHSFFCSSAKAAGSSTR